MGIKKYYWTVNVWHSMNRIQCKDHGIGTMKSRKFHCLNIYIYIYIYIQNNWYDRLSLGYQNSLEKTVILITLLKKAFLSSLFF